MPYKIEWYMPQKVLYAKMWGQIDPETTIQCDREINLYLNQGLKPVHFIVDLAEISELKIDVRQLRAATTYLQNPNLGWDMVVGTSGFTKFMATVITQLLPVRVKMLNSVTEAVEFLKTVEPNLDWSQLQGKSIK